MSKKRKRSNTKKQTKRQRGEKMQKAVAAGATNEKVVGVFYYLSVNGFVRSDDDHLQIARFLRSV